MRWHPPADGTVLTVTIFGFDDRFNLSVSGGRDSVKFLTGLESVEAAKFAGFEVVEHIESRNQETPA